MKATITFVVDCEPEALDEIESAAIPVDSFYSARFRMISSTVERHGVACHLALSSLDVLDPCGACGVAAGEHRNWAP